MRISTFLTLLLAVTVTATAQHPEQSVPSDITNVTVFLRGAEVARQGEVLIPRGTTELVFTGITPHLDPQSIQVAALGNFTVLGVAHRNNFVEDRAPAAEVARLLALKKVKEDSLSIEQMMQQVYLEEEAMLIANKDIGGTASGVQVSALQEAIAFYRRHLLEVKTQRLGHERTMARLQQEIEAINRQLGEMSGHQQRKPQSEITVTVAADAQTQGTFTLRYLTHDAGWAPRYDLRVEDIDNPIALTYKAHVYQRTGEAWDNVNLTLSTGNPSVSGTRPTLSPWYLEYIHPITALRGGNTAMFMTGVPAPAMVEEDAGKMREADVMEVTEIINTTTVEFAITLPYTITADGKPNMVQIATHELPATYAYYAAPKLDLDAFLTARITDWGNYNLLSGEASLFFEGTYVGKSHLNMQEVSDTLVVSLGRDKGIVIERTKLEDYTDRQRIGSKRTVSFGFEIEVRNTKRVPIEIVIEDQVPLSTDEDIEIKAEPGSARHDRRTGRLQWRLTLAPGSSETLPFGYTVKYPKDRQLVLE